MKAKKQMKGGAAKGKKKGKETPAERQLRLEMEALRAAELQKEIQDKNLQRLKDAIALENKFGFYNRFKITDAWRRLMRLAKVEDLRKEIEILAQNHEREVDRKDAIIQMLDRDLEEAEEQYQMALRSHLQNVDALIALQQQRLNAMQLEFNKELKMLQDEFNTEREFILNEHSKRKKEMHDIMQAMENEFNEIENDARQEFESQREEIKNKNSEDYNVLRITLEGQIEDLERHFESAHQNYQANTEQRTQAFKILTLKDQQSAKNIEGQMRKLQKLQDQLAHWKTKINNNAKENEERNKALREEKDAISAHFQELKARMNKFRESESKRLTELTLNARKAINELRKKLDLSEKIIKMAESNRKMETEQEKVLPFYDTSITEEEEKALKEDVEKTRSLFEDAIEEWAELPDGGKLDEWGYLDRFYQRFNKVYLDKIALQKERQRLSKENDELRAILKQYLDGISVNEDVMSNLNPLMVVNGRANVNMSIGGQQEHKPIVEGAHHVVYTKIGPGLKR